MSNNHEEITRLLEEAAEKRESLEKLWPLVYNEIMYHGKIEHIFLASRQN